LCVPLYVSSCFSPLSLTTTVDFEFPVDNSLVYPNVDAVE
jgi:hypothetical protein